MNLLEKVIYEFGISTLSIFVIGAMFKKNITIVNVWVAMVISWLFWTMCVLSVAFQALKSGYTVEMTDPDSILFGMFIYAIAFYWEFGFLKRGAVKFTQHDNGSESNKESKGS